MTPQARIAAAIDLLDRVLSGENAEKALTNWGRASRFAGSGDRNAVRDLVYDALRCRRSFAALGGGDTGRGLMLGALRAAGQDPATLFTGEGHAPAVLGPQDAGRSPEPEEASDMPAWLLAQLQASLGDGLAEVCEAMRRRAPVFLRVNTARISLAQAIAALADEGIVAQPHPLASTALEVHEGARKIQNSQCYQTGLVELQDASSQAVVQALPLREGMRVLDHCAGGGGKTLAMAAAARMKIFAHDASPARMRDLPARAARAGAKIALTERPETLGTFDLVLADAPCSGSGSWRRDPQGKWALTPQKLDQIGVAQAEILARVAPLVAPRGCLAYATCSLLETENGQRVAAFLAAHPTWILLQEHRFTPVDGGDGFYLALLTRENRNATQP
jgi:16S rRNA (cytosine967-C5)-methyltransferase